MQHEVILIEKINQGAAKYMYISSLDARFQSR